MKVNFSEFFYSDLENHVRYIYKDKPEEAKKFKKDLLFNLKKDLKNPFHFKKSIYFQNEFIRDYVFKGFTAVYEVDELNKIVTLLALIKYMEKL